jgi:archaetidylinositol phosphate synthase
VFSLLCAAAAGVLFYFSFTEISFLILCTIFIIGNGFLDALDGKVARVQKISSRLGDFLDHCLDRYSDVLIVGGIALSEWCDTRIGLVAVVGMLLTSYMGTQAQAVGYGRKYEGFLSRVDRLVILIVAPVIQFIFMETGFVLLFERFFLEWVMVYFAVVGNATALQRFFSVFQGLKQEGG